ncbi:MAG: hypothetical protein IJU58_02905 [Clostridia bacterium]|nr:hypothetical protein [Clostridia bacterium]
MLYSEKTPYKNQTVLNVTLSDFSGGVNSVKSESVLPLNYAVKTYNFDTNSGALRHGLGLSALTTPYTLFGTNYTKTYAVPNAVASIKNVWHYQRYDYNGNAMQPLLVIYGDNQKFYCTNMDTPSGFSEVEEVQFSGQPVGINYRLDQKDCMIFCSTNAQDGLYTWDSINYFHNYANAPSVSSLALHAGRLFATSIGDKKKLYFSDDLDPRNWEENLQDGGYIEISDERGALNKLIEWNNYLYIIRDYGITRVSAWGEQEDFVVRNLYLSTGKIYDKSAVHCGSCIIMLCKDGIYLFDGSSMRKINTGLDKFFENVENDNSVGAFLDGKYYLACKMNFGDSTAVGCENSSYINNVLLEYDINSGQINILRGVDISLLLNVQTKTFSRMVCCLNTDGKQNVLLQVDHSGQVQGVATHKYWQSPNTDLGYPNKQKVLNEIYITSATNAQLTINTDTTTYNFSVSASNSPQKYKLNIRCKTFNIVLSSDQATADIKPPTLKTTIV